MATKNNPKTKKTIIICTILVIIIISTIYYLKPTNTPQVHQRDYPQIATDSTLHILTSSDPIGFHVSGDTIVGYTYEVLKALEKYTNLHFDIQLENSLEKSFQQLQNNFCDLIARNIPTNSHLKSQYSFTQPLIHNKLVLIQRKAEYNGSIAPIRDHLQLAKKTIYVPLHSPGILRINNLSHEIGDTIYVAQDSTYQAEHLAMKVATNEIDYTICDVKTAQKLANILPEIDIKTDIGFTHLEAWAVRNTSTQLLDSLNTWIKHFKTTKEYDRIYKKYYQSNK